MRGPSLTTTDGRPLVIIGAGTIGRLMASEALLGGLPVTIIDKSPEALEAARTSLIVTIRQEIKDPIGQQGAVDRLSLFSGDLQSDTALQAILEEARCVVEALPENRNLKESVLGSLDSLVPPHIPITTVSSSFPVAELLGKANFKERFINTHPLQRGIAALEVMPSAITSPAVTQEVSSLFHGVGMVPVPVQRENIGFIFNIAWRSIKRTVLDLVERGVNSPQDFDRIWMMAFKTKEGPFGIMDKVGLDVVLAIEERYAKLSGKAEDEPPSFLRKLVQDGKLGVKSGEGFYRHPSPAYLSPGFLEISGAIPPRGVAPIRDTLLGAWELVSFTATKVGDDQPTHPMGEGARGKIMYSESGQMSVALVRGNRENFISQDPLSGTVDEKARAFSEYFSYCGTFRYRNGMVFHDVEHCSFPNWSGCTLMRMATLDEEGHLVLSTLPVEVAGSIGIQKLTWKKIVAR
jgi:3-hydroxybutyryl-CoA dehydrogenase